MAHIRFEKVTVSYPIYNAHAQSLRRQIISFGTGGKLADNNQGVVTVTALSGVSFEIKEGDRVGLVGHNGAGKSTLLRTMAGIFEPASGNVERKGRVSSIFEIGAGLDPELSGYENIRRMGMLIGLDRGQIEAATPDIEELTDLGEFLSLPVRTYSSGMTTRLMFAVATACPPEILLIDELLSAGDASFQTRAKERVEKLIASSSILVLASHVDVLLHQFCNRFFRLEHGTLVEISADEL